MPRHANKSDAKSTNADKVMQYTFAFWDLEIENQINRMRGQAGHHMVQAMCVQSIPLMGDHDRNDSFIAIDIVGQSKEVPGASWLHDMLPVVCPANLAVKCVLAKAIDCFHHLPPV
jgi:gluconate kinase